MIVTTHLMEEAERCDRFAILNEGKLVALGTPTELKHEIGGDVILLDATRDAESLAQRISARFQVDATVMGNQSRQSGAHRDGKRPSLHYRTWSKRFPERFRRSA